MSGVRQPEVLPTLDLRRFDAGGAERTAFLSELRSAAGGVGFFYLTGHGVEEKLVGDALGISRRFFALPEPDKLAIEMVNSPHFRGYNRAGFEHTRGKPDWREQVDIGPEREALPFDRSAPPWTRLQGPNQWPPRCRSSRRRCLPIRSARPRWRSGCCARLPPRSSSPRTSSSRSTRRRRTSWSRSFAIPAALRSKAIKGSAPTRISGS